MTRFPPPSDPDDLERWDRAMRRADNSDGGSDEDDFTRLGVLSPILTFDTIYHYRGMWEDGAICRVRIFEADDRPPVVVISELAENTGTSVSNLIEHLAPEIVKTDLPSRIHESPPAVFLEHVGAVLNARRRRQGTTVSRVSFASMRPIIVNLGGVDRLSYGEPTSTYLDATALEVFIGDGIDLDVNQDGRS
jgi:hypothetical protein